MRFEPKPGTGRDWAGGILESLFAVMTIVMAVSSASAYEAQFADPSKINLATVRGTKATASDNISPDSPPHNPLHGYYGEVRYRSNFGQAWWTMELPRAYTVSGLRVGVRRVITSLGFRVKTSAREADEESWASVKPVSDFNGRPSGTTDNASFAFAAAEFEPVKARSVRIEFYGHNGSENGGPGRDHPDLVFGKVQVWGSESLNVNPAISMAQSAWAGGSCTMDDPVQGTRPCPEAIDDNDPKANGFGNVHWTFFTKGSPSEDGVEQTDKPCRLTVHLKQRSIVEAVAYAAITRNRADRPRDMKIYTSQHDTGNRWTLQKEMRDIAGGEYEELVFDRPAKAKRVRFDIERVWNPAVDSNRKASSGHLAELYVFGSPLPPDFYVTLKDGGLTSCQIHDEAGKPIRRLWQLKQLEAGRHAVEWDGLDDSGAEAPDGTYEYRVLTNPATYKNVGAIGNNASPNTLKNHNAAGLLSIAVDAEGHVYTANDWEEAGQDFRKWHRDDGRHILDAEYQIRNGNPNGAPHAVAVDDEYIYCLVHGWSNSPNNSKQQVQRFRMADGKHETFTGIEENAGHVQLYEWPEKLVPEGTPEADAAIMRTNPLRAIAVSGDKLFVTDALGGKVHSFHKVTGAATGAFDVALPHALAIDPAGWLWVGHEHGKVTAFSPDGKKSRSVLVEPGHFSALAFGPDNTLYAADTTANQIEIYRVDTRKKTATKLRSFGRKAKPGEYAPNQFYELLSLAVDTEGNLIASQRFPTTGARLTKFSPSGEVVWDQLSLEFCSTGTYTRTRPNEVISQYFHRYELTDKSKGLWEYRGCVLASDPKYINWQHGLTSIRSLGGNEFLFQSYGDGLQVYRRDGGLYRLASMLGHCNPYPDGIFREHLSDEKRRPRGWWSWHDADGDGDVDDEEIDYFKKPGEHFQFAQFGLNVDEKGNAIYCEHHTHAIFEIPLAGLDEKGNPIYDLSATHEIIPADKTEPALMSQPLMAVRAEDGSVYVQGRSKRFEPPPESGMGWMAGWVVARYREDGTMMWYARLPEACPGIDVVPGGGGVILSSVKRSAILHYSADGILLGIARPGAAVGLDGDYGGIADNVASLQVNRDPKDGILDVFLEDCLCHRFLWFRVDDREKPRTITGELILSNSPSGERIVSPVAKEEPEEPAPVAIATREATREENREENREEKREEKRAPVRESSSSTMWILLAAGLGVVIIVAAVMKLTGGRRPERSRSGRKRGR